jgi:hypothetical protein
VRCLGTTCWRRACLAKAREVGVEATTWPGGADPAPETLYVRVKTGAWRNDGRGLNRPRPAAELGGARSGALASAGRETIGATG